MTRNEPREPGERGEPGKLHEPRDPAAGFGRWPYRVAVRNLPEIARGLLVTARRNV